MQAVFHDRREGPWQLIAGVVLAALLVTLATLQYRWIGEVGEAERARMRTSLQTRATDFTQAFDHELTQIYAAFHAEPGVDQGDPARPIGAELTRAQAAVAVPGLIKDVFLLESQGADAPRLRRFNPLTGALEASAWPEALERWRERATHGIPLGTAAGSLPIFLADAVDASAPALVVPMPFVKRIDGAAGHIAVLPDPSAASRAIVVWLDAERLRRGLLEPLVARYFGAGEASEYLVTIVDRERPSNPIYTSSAQAGVDERSADVSAGLFDLRINDLTRITGAIRPPGSASFAQTEQVAVTIVRRSNGVNGAGRVSMGGAANQGAWLLRARYRSGSLEAIVARSRRWNLAIGAAVLGLLGASFALVLAASQRQRRLARQQMEFVASVSHELRTPLAVICSAGENLADGVVADASQVKTYGSLIETEGRRLGDMVERVLRFAGIDSGRQTQVRAAVDVNRVIAEAVHGVAGEARERGVIVTVQPSPALPETLGDADALRSAVQNVIGNAVKYSTAGGRVGIAAAVAGDGTLKVRVDDHGIGIDAADLPGIFKPFFRGRRAIEAQVRGSGIGLSVVRHVIRSHGGDVTIESRAGEGTTVTIVLPIVSAASPAGERTVSLRPGAIS